MGSIAVLLGWNTLAAVSEHDLIAKLNTYPNLLLWIAGHRHYNAITPFPSPDPAHPELGFWQVETSSLRDFPQQFRTFEILLNADYTVSIVTTNVDPAVRAGTPAATSRAYSVAAQQIVQNDLVQNNVNQGMINKAPFDAPPVYYPPAWAPIPAMDPSRPQMPAGCYAPVPPAALDCVQSLYQDPSIQVGAVPGVPYVASYNAELLKQLSPAMVSFLRARYPQPR
jgi:hypothetical protein